MWRTSVWNGRLKRRTLDDKIGLVEARDLPEIDRAVTFLLQEENPSADLTKTFVNIFERTKKFNANPALFHLVKSLNEFFDTLTSGNVSTALPKYNISGSIANILENAERLNPHPVQPSLMKNLYDLVETVSSLVPTRR